VRGRIRQVFVVTRAKSAGNDCSIAMDFREKGFYPSLTPVDE
jgi:hypothetical protein